MLVIAAVFAGLFIVAFAFLQQEARGPRSQRQLRKRRRPAERGADNKEVLLGRVDIVLVLQWERAAGPGSA